MQIADLLVSVRANREALRRAQKIYQRRLAPNFKLFEFVKRDEMGVSRILGWMLDPKGSHGQGSRFLELFLGKLDLLSSSTAEENADVLLESSGVDGRLDILVRGKDYALVIENKPWASDQQLQLTRYSSYLRSLRLSGTRLVYLTRSGAEPSESSIDRSTMQTLVNDKTLHLWSYDNDVISWLTECRSICQADRVAMFIDEFARYLQTEFGGIGDMTELDHLVDEVTRSPEAIAATMEIIGAATAIRAKLLNILRTQLQDYANENGWALKWDVSEYPKYRGFEFAAPSCPYAFRFEFQQTFFNNLIFGAWKNKDAAVDRTVEEALNERFGQGSKNDFWVWYRVPSSNDPVFSAETNWQNSSNTWTTIADGDMSKKMIGAVRAYQNIFQR